MLGQQATRLGGPYAAANALEQDRPGLTFEGGDVLAHR